MKAARINDPRLHKPQCASLSPVRVVYENPWFKVCDRKSYFTIEYNQPQVIILPIVDNHSIVMVQVKRPVIADITWELPAGGLKENESPEAGAARELAEETGIGLNSSERLHPIYPISNSPNRNPNLLHIFKAEITQKEYQDKNSHDSEIKQVACITFEEIRQMIVKGEIYVGVPMAIIGRYFLTLSFSR